MALGDELVLAGDPEEEPAAEEEEEEDEEDIVDPHDDMKEQCKQTPACQTLDLKLIECTKRVESAEQTEETCHEEFSNLIHCIDHCVAPKLFSKLK
ncbi:cytochrome b-c1 complex subunit 6, mitochondrial-like [Mizuhopecten yessoensis]|uniref:Cytochrome b-c1 complex subunit 6, mitochondrial n=1 Tax=Mizuhopecten yessoensis TaxID=6573 RepID=A0A210QJT9_MIZYE|nr:cytochrome b-c1 complex subunit 6, mitochondrial-like [Mizuhopecten yessoensis]OWF48881.1 Cytochrome b-c1 complex subunit 6, mitochondrial [Mizuhopecten yessoensis]